MKSKRLNPKRVVLAIIAVLYLATWVWGIPAVHTMIARDVIKSYKNFVRVYPSKVSVRHPHIRFGASYVILPLVTVNHYEYQSAGLAGWGGFTVDVWYGRGRVTIFRFAKWIS